MWPSKKKSHSGKSRRERQHPHLRFPVPFLFPAQTIMGDDLNLDDILDSTTPRFYSVNLRY